jgi:hypothetical protein
MWHFLVAYISNGSLLLGWCDGAIDTLWYPILPLVGAKKNLLREVPVS